MSPTDLTPHVERMHCNECGHDTKHKRIHHHEYGGQEPEDDPAFWWKVYFDLFECLGCEEVVLRRSEDTSEDDPEEPRTAVYYPPRTSREIPRWLWDIEDGEVIELFKELYTALHADSRRLAMMGCRATIDQIMQGQVGDTGTFGDQLEALETRKLLSHADRELLEAAIDAGNASAHRGYLPSSATLNVVVDIVEHLARSVLLRGATQTLRETTPSRCRPRRSGNSETSAQE